MSNSRLIRIMCRAMLALCAVLSVHAAQITVAWDPPAEPVASFNVYYSTATRGTSVVAVQTNSAVIPNLVDGLSYTFYVTAVNSEGAESEPSEPITYTVPGVPPEPENSEPEPAADQPADPMPSLPPAAGSIAQTDAQTFTIQFSAAPGAICTLEGTDSFELPVWTPLATQIADEAGLATFTDAPWSMARFYRAVAN